MKKIGIVGGLGPEPTVEYYKIITGYFHGRREGYPRIVIYSMDVNELCGMFEAEDWNTVVDTLYEGIRAIQAGGAEFGMIAANTPHIVFDQVAKLADIPLLSIVKETLKEAKNMNLSRLGLLGTGFTMSSNIFQREFGPEGIEVFVPDREEQDYVHQKIYGEITMGRFRDETREGLRRVINGLIDRHSIEGVVLGCTELPLILTEGSLEIPALDTTRIHAESAVRYCTGDE